MAQVKKNNLEWNGQNSYCDNRQSAHNSAGMKRKGRRGRSGKFQIGKVWVHFHKSVLMAIQKIYFIHQFCSKSLCGVASPLLFSCC